ncbi:Protein of unknown function [Pyronema omphalodes CBS 100304]|uniref:Uncharacterized protein n=1 Tax=Pyronema omphalodes (strain CBS 100304) TaxID=1076935 RepID=U4LHG0_PYROM|nr:Protein of unknown function [Pyronema omphalodes CBS 100304]
MVSASVVTVGTERDRERKLPRQEKLTPSAGTTELLGA